MKDEEKTKFSFVTLGFVHVWFLAISDKLFPNFLKPWLTVHILATCTWSNFQCSSNNGG